MEFASRESAGLRQRPPLAGSQLAWNTARVLLVAPALLAVLLLAYESSLIADLPPYPAVILSFAAIVVVPGLVLQAVFLQGSGLGPVERLAVAVPLGLAVSAVPGFVVLEWHLDLQDFAATHAVFAAITCGVAMLFWRPGQPSDEREEPATSGGLVLVALLLIILGGVVTTPFWAEGRIAADFDDWTYLAYVNNYLEADEINVAEPLLGTDEEVNPRMRSNVWVLLQALVSDVAEVPASDAVLEYLRPILTVFAIVATFALTQSLFRNLTISLLAPAFQLGYGFLDLSAHEGFGRNLFTRISEDKMIGAFIIFPVALVFLSRFVRRPAPASYAGFTAVVLGLAVVHPVPLMFLATTILFLGAYQFWERRSLRGLAPAALLIMPVGLASIWPFIQRQLLIDTAPELFGTEASSITFRDEFHTVEIGAGLLMGNFHMILHPLMIAAIALVPVTWYLARKSHGHQLFLAVTAGALVVFFTPLLATPVAELMTPQTLWKMPWMIPVGPVLALAAYEGAGRLRRLVPVEFIHALVPGVILVGVLGLALVVNEQYERVDEGAFYDWTSTKTVIPGSGDSIFRGGLDRTFTTTWRIPEEEAAMLKWVERQAFDKSVVLAEPPWIHHVIPGFLKNVYPVDFGGAAGEGDRRRGATAFTRGAMSVAELEEFLDRYSVDFIIAREVEPASDVLRESERAHFREEFSPYLVYEVR